MWVLGSTKNMLYWRGGRDSFHFCSFQTLLQISGCLTAYLPENKLSRWPVQMSLFAQLAAHLCLLIRCGTVVASLPALDRGTTWTCGSVQKATALLKIRHHMSHLVIIIIFQAVWTTVRKILVRTVFWALAWLDPSFHAVSHCLLLQTNLRGADCRARGKFPKCS